jgi:hypothetical protein
MHPGRLLLIQTLTPGQPFPLRPNLFCPVAFAIQHGRQHRGREVLLRRRFRRFR